MNDVHYDWVGTALDKMSVMYFFPEAVKKCLRYARRTPYNTPMKHLPSTIWELIMLIEKPQHPKMIVELNRKEVGWIVGWE